MTENIQESSETITATLLQNLLQEAPRIAQEAHKLLAPLAEKRHQLREELATNNLITTIGEPGEPPESIVAVDGGNVREPLYATDLLVAVAVSAEGMTPVQHQPLHQSHWCHILPHHSDNDRLLSAAMAAQELNLIGQLTHSLRILDGSTTSTIVTLNNALNIRNPELQQIAADLITDDLLDVIHSLGDHEYRVNPGTIVALPKSDSTRWFLNKYHKKFGVTFSGNDRFMAAQVLEPGEMLYPRLAAEHGNVNLVAPRDLPDNIAEKVYRLGEAVNPIRQAAKTDRLVVTYIKPETSDTVIKLETLLTQPLPSHPDLNHPALQEIQTIARYLSDETPGPHMQEPFPQYAVDLAAKNVSIGTDALNQSMLASLPQEAEIYLPYLLKSYRTTTNNFK